MVSWCTGQAGWEQVGGGFSQLQATGGALVTKSGSSLVSSSAKHKTGVNGTNEQNDPRELFHIRSRNFQVDTICFLFNAF